MPSSPRLITGGCYCGAVRFSASGPGMDRTNCHCANCRRAVGAQSVAWITVPSGSFAYETPPPQRYRTVTGAWRTFCPTCGTSLTYEHDDRPGEIDLTVGSLDRPEDFPPEIDSYPEEKLPWVAAVPPSASRSP